ncbi:hypothetical protein GO613_12870 [Azoarcus communis]|uniref:hypothetical protein n=1 Tax=Parazoarcus communis TaxID=41977 RepID=UPI0014598D70|nr:hypothetical protein [Parazoarcus communis]NMG48994.1 hypothetical protein [Parazoarcus communis]
MSLSQPFNDRLPHELKEEHLELVASWLLDEWRATEDDLVRDTDTPYTRGTTRFGRQQKRFWLEHLSGKHPWLRVLNNSLDIVFEINGIPCRFSNDNAEAPKKRAVLEVHQHQIQFLEEADSGEAARFVFVIDCGFDESSEPGIVLLGFSASGEEVCRWTSGGVVRTLGEASHSAPAPIELPRPSIAPKRKLGDEGDDAFASIGS